MLSQVVPPSEDLMVFRPHQYLGRANEVPDGLFYIMEGWGLRYHMLADGRRQITALYVPGDLCDPCWAFGRAIAQPIVALTVLRATRIQQRQTSGALSDQHTTLWKHIADQYERQASWLVTLGRKTASERVAHLLFELFDRMRRAGLAYGQQCALPLTQLEIADITGLTPVHVNRTLQSLRAKGVVDLQSKWLRIPDLNALQDIAALPASADVKPRSQ
jgi:CRP-like cAMP-binding protein